MSPKEDATKTLAFLLEEQRRKERFYDKTKNYERVKDILIYLTFFGTCIFAPKAIKIFRPILKDKDYSSWKSFNLRYLKWTLNRLSKQKMVDIREENGDKVVIITQKY